VNDWTTTLPWLNGWPRMGLTGVLIGTATHCIGCGRFNGTTTVAFTEDWVPPGELPTWPFTAESCPVCAYVDMHGIGPVHDVRVSELQAGQEWLLGGAWVRVVRAVVRHPDDRVAITYEQDDEQITTREHRGFERAAVR
jgi:hypothetical protein